MELLFLFQFDIMKLYEMFFWSKSMSQNILSFWIIKKDDSKKFWRRHCWIGIWSFEMWYDLLLLILFNIIFHYPSSTHCWSYVGTMSCHDIGSQLGNDRRPYVETSWVGLMWKTQTQCHSQTTRLCTIYIYCNQLRLGIMLMFYYATVWYNTVK